MSQQPQPKPVKDMSGYIAKNDKKTNPKQPDFRGKVSIKGKEYALSLWVKDDRPDLMSVSVTDMEEFNKNNPPRQTSSHSTASAPNKSSSSESDDKAFDDLFGSL